MKPIWPILSLLLGCTEFDDSVDSAVEELTERMRMGRIEGVVRRSAALQGDGLGNIIVLAFFAQTPAVDRYPLNVLILPYQDLSEPDAEIPYTLYNFFPEPEPYYLLAVFDEDYSLMDEFTWVPTAGDLISTNLDDGDFQAIFVESGDVLQRDLILTEVVTKAP